MSRTRRLPILLLCLPIILALLWSARQSSSVFLDRRPDAHSPEETPRVLFLTAHPDDECLFFGPTLTSLLSSPNPDIYSLCLSVGDGDGDGAVRSEELMRSLDVFGVQPGRRWVLDHQ